MNLVKDGWKLTGGIRWEPVDYDVRESCNSCLGRGKSEYDWDNVDCTQCSGLGFTITRKERGPEPVIPKHLIQWMKDAYQEWVELYGGKYAN